jgi:hypothetical protein
MHNKRSDSKNCKCFQTFAIFKEAADEKSLIIIDIRNGRSTDTTSNVNIKMQFLYLDHFKQEFIQNVYKH